MPYSAAAAEVMQGRWLANMMVQGMWGVGYPAGVMSLQEGILSWWGVWGGVLGEGGGGKGLRKTIKIMQDGRQEVQGLGWGGGGDFGGMPATGHPQMTQTTAAKTTCGGLPLSTPLAAQVSMYMAKLLGKRLVAAVNMPLERTSRSSR